MKYNTLSEYRRYLEARGGGGLARSTADTYYKAMSFLLTDQFIINCKDINIMLVLNKLRNIKYKSYFSKYKNAFLKFCEYQKIKLSASVMAEINQMMSEKKKKYRKHKKRTLADIKNRVRVIRDKKLRLSYLTMINSGLRVSELAQIKKQDCKVTNDGIRFDFIAKGGERQTAYLSKTTNKKLFCSLIELIENACPDNAVFYSSSHLETQAYLLGFMCHDLRRAFAKLTYQQNSNIEWTRQALRHSKTKTTQIYLYSKLAI